MVDKIFNIKNQFVQRVEKEVNERGVERIDINEIGRLVDIIKDLAEAEKECMQAEYYKTVTEAMTQQSGYGSGGSGYGSGGSGYNSGGGTGSSAGYGSMRRGYGGMEGYSGYGGGNMRSGHQQVEELMRLMQNAAPEERERLKNELRTGLGAM